METLAINFATVAHFQDGNDSISVVNVVQDPVIPNSHAPAGPVFEFAASRGGAGVVRQVGDLRFDSVVRVSFKGCQLPLCAREDPEGVAHLRPRSILRTASSNGAGISPEAFASS